MRHLSFFHRLGLVWRFLRNPQTGALPRVLALFGVLYILSPFDLIPGLPILSSVDDIVVLLLVLRAIEGLMGKRPGGGGQPGGGGGNKFDEDDPITIDVDGEVR